MKNIAHLHDLSSPPTETLLHDLTHSVKSLAHEVRSAARESSADWYQYVRNHPFQTMVYGVLFFYALKGALRP